MTAAERPAGPRPVRVAVCVSHPVAYFCALYAEVAADPRLELTVLFSVRTGADPYVDAEFATLVDPGLGPLLSRFTHRFLTSTADLGAERRLAFSTVSSALDAIDPDVVLIYGFHRAISRAGWGWAQRRRRPLAYVSDSEDRGLRPTSALVRLVKRLPAAMVMRGVDRVLAVGDANAEFHRRRGVPARRIVRVPFPIDRAAFDGRGDATDRLGAELRAANGLEDRLVVLSSGKLVPRKRQADLVDAVAASAHRDAMVLVLLGDGPDRRMLEERARERSVRLIVTGFTPPDALPPWYRVADVYAHVAEFDPHPLAVSEAVYCGLPVIISDRTGSWGPTDDVVPEENGLVVPVGDVRAITAALDRLLGDAAVRAAFAAASGRRGRTLQDVAYRGFADQLVDLARVGRRP